MGLIINGHKIYDIKNCMGASHDSKQCPYMNECDLKDWYSDSSVKVIVYRIKDLKNPMECKRDNPNFKPMSKKQFMEIYKQMPGRTDNV